MKLLKRIQKTLKKETGQALPMALVMLLLGGLLVVPTIIFMNTNLKANRVEDESNQRVYAADAGIHYAFNKFTHDVTFDPEDPLEFPEELNPVNGCEVSLAKTPVDDLTWEITSVAHDLATGKNTTITAYFLANEEAFEEGASAFDYAIATLGGNLTMTGSSSITSDCSPQPCNEGDVWVNGDIVLDWSCNIYGDANVTGTCNRDGNVKGTLTEGSDPIGRPEWLDDQLDCYIANTNVAWPTYDGPWDTVYNGNTTLGWSQPYTFGSLKVNGNLTISGTNNGGIYNFNGPVWVTGNLIISSGANFITFHKPVRVGKPDTTYGYADFGGTGWVKFESPAPQTTITYGSHAPGTAQGSGIYISGDSASVILTSGTYGSGGTVDVTLQDSPNNSVWTDVSPCGAFSQVTEMNDGGTYRLNYTGTQPYLRAVATVSGATCQFGVSIVKNTTLHVNDYLNINGSRSCWFDGPVVVDGKARTGNYIAYIGGAKYGGVAWDIVFKGTLRATEPTPNCSHKIYVGGSKNFEFYDAVYTNVSAELAGATGSNMTFTEAFIADCNIVISGSSNIVAPATTSPYLVSRYGNVDQSGATLVDAIVYAPEGNVHVSGSSQLEGAIVSESALLEGAVVLKYPVIFRERVETQPPGGGEGGPGESVFSIISYSIQ
jgi:hypothetical protein